jgi:hypothetical protein
VAGLGGAISPACCWAAAAFAVARLLLAITARCRTVALAITARCRTVALAITARCRTVALAIAATRRTVALAVAAAGLAGCWTERL